jgi:hypothetical protein
MESEHANHLQSLCAERFKAKKVQPDSVAAMHYLQVISYRDVRAASCGQANKSERTRLTRSVPT